MKIIDPGLSTTVQDRGRLGYGRFGITPSGAMDPLALELGNILVSNDRNAAGLELTVAGPTIEFESDCSISICGADLSPEIADMTLPTWRAIAVRKGSVLRFGSPRWGCRSFLAVSGGIDVPEVMGSRSTYTRARLGGFHGRALRAHDEVPVGGDARAAPQIGSEAIGPMPFALSERFVAPDDAVGLYEPVGTVRVLPGPHFHLFAEDDRTTFLNEAFEVSPRSDRMGYRLAGPPLASGRRKELISSAVLTGTVQVPRGGEPIVLMSDRQTTGGYPIIAQVASVDLPAVAQLKPGDEIRFEAITLEQAHTALRAQHERLRAIAREVTVNEQDRP